MKKLIDINQLGFNTNKKIGRIIAKTLSKWLGVNKLNQIIEEVQNCQNTKEIYQKILENKNVKIQNKGNNIVDAIKTTEAQVIVCNLPHGILDAIIMLNTILEIRTDVKILTNEICENIKEINENVISLNKPRTQKVSTQNITKLRNIEKFIKKNKGLLIVFPAINVATYQNGLANLKDNQWNQKLTKLILKWGENITPVTICGRNSTKFHILNKINPKLSKITLLKEFVNKNNETIDVIFGKPIEEKIIERITEPKELEKLIRANMIILRNIREEKYSNEKEKNKEIKENGEKKTIGGNFKMGKSLKNIIKENNILEIINIEEKLKVFENQQIESFIINKNTNKEIDKLANEKIKKQQNENHNSYIIVKDKNNSEIITLAEIGYGNKIMKNVGANGFYCYENFDFSHKIIGILEKSIEIGQVAILEKEKTEEECWEYIIISLKKHIQKNHKIKNIIGTTEVCDTESYTARRLVVNQLMEYDYDKKYKKLVHSNNNIKGLITPILNSKSMMIVRRLGAFGHLIKDADNQYISKSKVFKMIKKFDGKIIGINSTKSNGQGKINALVNIPKNNVPRGTLHENNKG